MEIAAYMTQARDLLLTSFPGRLVCLGLQGSYARGEATAQSDIDLVVILDQVEMADILRYKTVLDALPERERSCGFFSGKEELLAWDRGELFQFYHDTRTYYGGLEFLRPLLNRHAVERALHTGACAIYHGCIHNLLHGGDREMLRELYKPALFLLQAACWLEQGIYCSSAGELLTHLEGADRKILERRTAVQMGGGADAEQFLRDSEALLSWAKGLILFCGGPARQ